MAVGDAIVVMGNTGDLLFQPASGVEICITWVASSGGSTAYTLYDGNLSSHYSYFQDSSVVLRSPLTFFITNAVYLRNYGANVKGFTGIQIK